MLQTRFVFVVHITTLNDDAPPNRGRLDIKPDGEDWGVICESGWGDEDANVACRQLGYTGVGRAMPRKEKVSPILC